MRQRLVSQGLKYIQWRSASTAAARAPPKSAGPSSPPPPEAEPSVGQSSLLLQEPAEALATKGLTFADGHGLKGPNGRGREVRRMNLHQAIRDALGTALATNPKSIVFGEDVETGVFRCTLGLMDEFGKQRVFNTPLTEQGIAGFAIGYASIGGSAIAEIQFGDYIFPAFDQIVNEAAKQHYASGGGYPLQGGSLTIRAPIGSVGHGALYHSQSPEGFFLGAHGLKVVIPRTPIQAKGLLLAAVRDPCPTLVLEPKILYRAAAEMVPVDDYTLPLGDIDVLREGTDLTVLSYGTPLYTCQRAIELLVNPPASLIPFLPARLRPPNPAPSIQLIDVRCLNPLPLNSITEAVRKTGRMVVVHESGKSGGAGNNIAGEVARRAFDHLEAPIALVSGWDTPVPLAFERFYQPDVIRIFDKMVETLNY
ncbi:Thiamin diphosphate-binding protein [Kockovaella imperatae]|uniref:3-methyl-2-oxobutanoate dehydrogenase (2-methylpropanoyl-transferring) n=1 Tax=Kockovaella imperatae TaxID=4999 RepID=A0A1Y1UCK1_9TREE|nr:Thiamin diphosphate-binding protein [Kockovaella imperatae]ORX35773.1 Thiamin diphosphate-binding protein [Kockovaella imperatae]